MNTHLKKPQPSVNSKSKKPERIQKLLASFGIASRREVEAWIKANRLTVNGQLAQLGDKAVASDQFKLDGRQLMLESSATATTVLIMNKANDVISTAQDPMQRKTVFEFLPECPSGRWIMVGRLDINTEGLLLFTNDGDLAHRLMHPSSQVEREYRVRVHGNIEDGKIMKLLQGVQLEDGFAKFNAMIHRAGKASNHWFDVSVASGRNRLVRRLWESQGCQVNRLIRTRYGNIVLPEDLAPNQVRQLSKQHLQALQRLVGK